MPSRTSGSVSVHCLSTWHFMVALTLNLLTTAIVAPPSNARKWQMGFNSAFKGLSVRCSRSKRPLAEGSIRFIKHPDEFVVAFFYQLQVGSRLDIQCESDPLIPKSKQYFLRYFHLTNSQKVKKQKATHLAEGQRIIS
jgi:hypothetical protein